MFPQEEPCFKCVCSPNFKNSTYKHNQHCSEIECGTSLHDNAKVRHGCIPVYFGDKTCCPIAWRCREYIED
jgi:hypothetical protein